MSPVIQALLTIVIGVGGCVGYFYGANVLLDKVLFPASGENAGRNINRANAIRPWIFLFPAMVALGLYLAYPVVATLWLSLLERLPGNEYAFVGLDNYTRMFAEPKFVEAMRNNMLWLIVVPAASTAFGLLVAQLTDRLSWGNIAKSIVFMPMAISLVGASVIFKLVYEARPAETAQIGVLNAVWMQFDGGISSFLMLKAMPVVLLLGLAGLTAYGVWILIRPILRGDGYSGAWMLALRALVALLLAWIVWECVAGVFGVVAADLPYGEPQQWLTLPFYNNFFLMVVLIWIQTGFAMVILSAALRGIPEETVEAAIVDGANPVEVFFQIKMPQIMGTIVVVWTTITIIVLKVFDIVFAMTNGQWETQVLANYMYDKLFRANDWGMGSAAAMIIMLLVTPILVWNVINARKEMR